MSTLINHLHKDMKTCRRFTESTITVKPILNSTLNSLFVMWDQVQANVHFFFPLSSGWLNIGSTNYWSPNKFQILLRECLLNSSLFFTIHPSRHSAEPGISSTCFQKFLKGSTVSTISPSVKPLIRILLLALLRYPTHNPKVYVVGASSRSSLSQSWEYGCFGPSRSWGGGNPVSIKVLLISDLQPSCHWTSNPIQ